MSAKNWCFTCFNLTAPFILENFSYIIFQIEICPKTKREHAQGYVQLFKKAGAKKVVKYFPYGTHIEKAKGSLEENQVYCTKPEDRKPGTSVFEKGIPVKTGERTDLVKCYETIQKSGWNAAIKEFTGTAIRYHKHMNSLLKMGIPIRTWKTIVWNYYGPTGTGKTREALSGGGDICVLLDGPKLWADNYFGQETVVIDEFRGQLPIQTLLMIMDQYQCTVEYKGGICQWSPKKLIICSPQKMTSYYSCHGEDLKQIDRRVDLYREFLPIQGDLGNTIN